MADKRDKRGLGRGLSSLLGDPGAAPEGDAGHSGPDRSRREVPLDAIHPNPEQPRREIDPDALAVLVDSIRAEGLLQPLVVRETGGAYELIAGERRWRAAQDAGLDTVPVLIRDAAEVDRLRLALVENVIREDLNPIDVANGCATLIDDFGQTHEEVGRALGRSRASISNLVRLLELPEDVQALLGAGALSEGHGRAILMADGPARRRRVAEEAVSRGLSVRATEALARGSGSSSTRRGRSGAGAGPAGDAATEAFGARFDVPVRVRTGRRGELLVELRFADEAALEAALDRLG